MSEMLWYENNQKAKVNKAKIVEERRMIVEGRDLSL